MKRTHLNFLIDLAAALLFLCMLATGFLLSFPLPPGTNKSLTLWGLSRHQWGGVHFWISGALLAVLLVHLALHWQWVVSVVRQRLGQAAPAEKTALASGFLAVLVVGGAFALFAWASYRSVRVVEEPCCPDREPTAAAPNASERPARGAPPGEMPKIAFWTDVYPILEASCLSCHGPGRASAGFRIDRREDFFGSSRGGPFVIPGSSSASPLAAIISGARKGIAMPERHRLPEKELAVVKRWIDEGAHWPDRPESKQ